MSVLWQPTLDDEATKWVEVARQLNVEQFGPLAEELDRDQRYPWENVDRLVESGLAGLMIPTEWAGQGARLTTGVAVMAELSRACPSTAAIFAIYAMGATPIIMAGTDAQKRAYLPGITQGEAVSFGLTERGAGSDPAAMTCSAAKEGDAWRITGEKIFIGNGGASKHYIVFVKTPTESNDRAISAFFTSEDDDGTIVDNYADRMGMRGTQTSNLRLDTLVDESRLVGELGRGLRLALSTLTAGRVMTAAQSLGMATAAFEHASNEATKRTAFGHAIIDYQGISFRLADAATRLSAARMLVWEAALSSPELKESRTLSSMAKLYATEVAHEAVDLAVQVFGGDGYCKPNPVERLYRDQRIGEIYEGSSEIQRLGLARAIGEEARSGSLDPLQPPTAAYGHPVNTL